MLEIDNVLFEWDPNKNAKNIGKHGLDFETALQSWDDPDGGDIPDEIHSTPEEERFLYFGRIRSGEVVCISFTELAENHIRIISAFKGTKEERIYYENFFGG